MQRGNNSNLHHTLHRLRDIADYWPNCRFLQGGGAPLFNAVNPKTHDCEIWPQETRNVILSYKVKNISIF